LHFVSPNGASALLQGAAIATIATTKHRPVYRGQHRLCHSGVAICIGDRHCFTFAKQIRLLQCARGSAKKEMASGAEAQEAKWALLK
jgi:hypothetical protein